MQQTGRRRRTFSAGQHERIEKARQFVMGHILIRPHYHDAAVSSVDAAQMAVALGQIAGNALESELAMVQRNGATDAAAA